MFHSTIPGPATAIAPRTQRNPASRQPFLNLNALTAKAIVSLSLVTGCSKSREGRRLDHFINLCRRAAHSSVLCCETISIPLCYCMLCYPPGF
jgi:hypothetical protein